ncbi:MAG: lipoyl(octanoyl) transferase LipB [Phycisphaeraceae bacterium]|nr:lipoyl(octanoyl) transferase LipB [Phycisphaeraceae bacterium]
MPPNLETIDLGSLPYAEAYRVQVEHVDRLLDARERGEPRMGTLLLVEHDPPVITLSRRSANGEHLLATADHLAAAGVTLAATDRGGDITYHGPGQLVAYPILDLNYLRLGLHDYMRLLEQAVIQVCDGFGLATGRDLGATGVWTSGQGGEAPAAKVCAMGVRVRKWISMHGLALNVSTNLEHFRLIVPCGLAGRPVTSLSNELGPAAPSMGNVKLALAASLSSLLRTARDQAARSGDADVA